MSGCHFPIRKAKRALLGCIGRETGIPDGDGDLDGDVEISEFGHDEKNAILIGTVTVYYIQFLPTSMSSPTYKHSDLRSQYSVLGSQSFSLYNGSPERPVPQCPILHAGGGSLELHFTLAHAQ